MKESYPLPGQIFRHYKGGTYEVISLATHTETKEIIVVYKSLNFGSVYVRPYDNWIEVSKNGDSRFTLI